MSEKIKDAIDHMHNLASLRSHCHSLFESDFIRKVAETFITRVLLIALGLITTVLVARALGPEGRGVYAAAVMLGAIGVQLGNIGLHASNTYYVAQDRRLLSALLGNTISISIAFGGLGSIIAWLVFTKWPSLAPVDGALLIMALTWIPCGLAYMLVQNLLLGIQEIRTFNIVEMTTKALAVALIALLIMINRVSVDAVFASSFLALATGFFWIWQKLKPHLHCSPKWSSDLFKRSINFGLRAYLAALFSFLVLRADLLMLKYMLGPKQTGYYSIAAAMAEMVIMLPLVIGTVLFPTLSAMDNHFHKWRLARKVALITGLIMTGMTLIAGLLARPMVQLIFGTVFLPAVPAFTWLLPGIFFLSINMIFMNYFASVGMPIVTVISPCMATLLNICLNLYLIPALGIVGSALASSISYTFMALISACYLFGSRVKKVNAE